MSFLYHIARREDWDRACDEGVYTESTLGKSLGDQGYIHASHASQVKGVADLLYHGLDNLLLLTIDPALLTAEVREETPPGATEPYPHIYGPIDLSAIVLIEPYAIGPEGFPAVEERSPDSFSRTPLIAAQLDAIEASERVTVLHAVESGSRGWGFPSPDSDYDVRFVYARPLDHYLRLDKTRDVIIWEAGLGHDVTSPVLDVNGWDLSKTLRLINASNPTIFEWLDAPIVYATTAEWGRIATLARDYFQVKSAVLHYLSMAVSNYRDHLRTDQVHLKKYFYVLRPILACRWILETGTPPPTLFTDLVEAELDDTHRPTVMRLLMHKRRTPNLGIGPRDDALGAFVEGQLDTLSKRAAALKTTPTPGWKPLNKLFRDLVGA